MPLTPEQRRVLAAMSETKNSDFGILQGHTKFRVDSIAVILGSMYQLGYFDVHTYRRTPAGTAALKEGE